MKKPIKKTSLKLKRRPLSTHALTMKLLRTPPRKWQALVAQLSSPQKMDIRQELRGIIQEASRLQGYLLIMDNVGDHAEGVEEANKVVRKIRKLLGYAYPKANDIDF